MLSTPTKPSPKNTMERENGQEMNDYQGPCLLYTPPQMPKTISFRKDFSSEICNSPPSLPNFDREGDCHRPQKFMMQHQHIPPQPVHSSAPIPGYHMHQPPPPAYYGYPPVPYAYPSYQWAPPVTYVSVEYIRELNPNDVLSGRGGATNSYRGNKAFRELVKDYQQQYLKAKKRDKPAVASIVVETIRKRGGRFLRRCNEQQGELVWVDIGDDRAREKTCQALREGAPEIRRKGEACPSPPTSKDKIANKLSFAPSEDSSAEQSSRVRQSPNDDEPIRVRPWNRLMPKRAPIQPIELDDLPADQREMYLRDFMPPTWPSCTGAAQKANADLICSQ